MIALNRKCIRKPHAPKGFKRIPLQSIGRFEQPDINAVSGGRQTTCRNETVTAIVAGTAKNDYPT